MPETAAVEIKVPSSVMQLRLLERVDYEDAFLVDIAVDRSPRQWMRAFIQGAPRWFQVPWVALGVVLLGARFGPLRGSAHVLGWRVLVDRSDVFAVGLESVGGLRARLVAMTPPNRAIIATQIQLDTAYARAVWPAIRRGHRHFAPDLLARAATHLSSRTLEDTRR